MSIRLAERIGFCFGVRRAVNIAQKALKGRRRIYSLGSIIHNKQVVAALSENGLKVIKDTSGIDEGAVLISSHGLSPRIKEKIRAKGLEIIDTTCPFVLKAQNVARKLGKGNGRIVVVGEAGHPEIKALVDFVPKSIDVVRDRSQARKLNLSPRDKVSVISQTTQSTRNLLDVVREISRKNTGGLKVYNTICEDVKKRQSSAKALAGSVDVMLIIGGKDSANTKRLFQLCSEVSKNCYWVETEKGVKDRWLKSDCVVGIASGASTPDWEIEKVINKVRKIQKSKGKGLCT